MKENGGRVFLGIFILIFSFVKTHAQSLAFRDSSCQCEEFPIEGKPFVALWNAPTGGCEKNFSVGINLKDFEIYANEHQTWNGKYVTVFYNAQLGLYPYFTNSAGTHSYNGGMPQLVNLDAHLEKSQRDIIDRIPDPNFNGLAVIDWEGWRPVWERNWDSKKIYQTSSIEIARSQNPDWSLDKLVELAKNQFEDSSRQMMEKTIKLGKSLRPKGKWGFYGFPNCYGGTKTDFKCSGEHEQLNDRLSWMFDASTALYPSIYLLEINPTNGAFVRGRIMETVRHGMAQAMNRGAPIPMFPYFRFIYEENPLSYNFLTDEDLRNTIGQAADLGAAGIVMWGNRRDENTSPDICRQINYYIQTKLGPYYLSLERQTERCSEQMCRGHGRCIRGVTSVGLDINQKDMIRQSCPGTPRTFSAKKTESPKSSHQSRTKEHDKNTLKDEIIAEKLKKVDSMADLKNDSAEIRKDGFPEGKKKTVSDKDVSIDVSEVLEQGLDIPHEGITQSGGIHYNDKYESNQTSSESETTNPGEIPTEMVYCNKTEVGTTKCVLVKGHTSAELSKNNSFRMPKIYAILISISLGGALLLSTVYIATYYYFNIYKRKGKR